MKRCPLWADQLENGIPSSGLRQPCTRHTLREQSEDWSLVPTPSPQPGVLLQQQPAGHFMAALSTEAEGTPELADLQCNMASEGMC